MKILQMTGEEFIDLKQSVNRIETAILGDEAAGIEGMVKKVDRHEKMISSGQKIIWLVLGGGTVFTGLLQILKILK